MRLVTEFQPFLLRQRQFPIPVLTINIDKKYEIIKVHISMVQCLLYPFGACIGQMVCNVSILI